MNPLKRKQVEHLYDLGCEDLADKVNEIVDFLNLNKKETTKVKLELEDHNFKIDSTGWKKKTEGRQDYLKNPEGDVWELINCKDSKLNGEQLFTFKAMIREVKKAGKRVPTDEEYNELLKTKENKSNLVFASIRFTRDSFNDSGKHARFWSSYVTGVDAWCRYLLSNYSPVYRDGVFDQAFGFSVRCLKNEVNN